MDVFAEQVSRSATASGDVVIPSVNVDGIPETEPEEGEETEPSVIGTTEEQTITVSLPFTWTEDGHADVIFTFEFNDEIVEVHHPQENWHSGKHTILLYYPIENVVANYTNTFNVYYAVFRRYGLCGYRLVYCFDLRSEHGSKRGMGWQHQCRGVCIALWIRYRYGSGKPYGEFIDGKDGYWYGFSNQQNTSGNAAMLWIKIKKSDLSFTEGSWTLSNVTIPEIGSYKFDSYPTSVKRGVIRNSYLYIPAYDKDGIYKINLSNSTDVTKIDFGFTSAMKALGGSTNCENYLILVGDLIIGWDFQITINDTAVFQYKGICSFGRVLI